MPERSTADGEPTSRHWWPAAKVLLASVAIWIGVGVALTWVMDAVGAEDDSPRQTLLVTISVLAPTVVAARYAWTRWPRRQASDSDGRAAPEPSGRTLAGLIFRAFLAWVAIALFASMAGGAAANWFGVIVALVGALGGLGYWVWRVTTRWQLARDDARTAAPQPTLFTPMAAAVLAASSAVAILATAMANPKATATESPEPSARCHEAGQTLLDETSTLFAAARATAADDPTPWSEFGKTTSFDDLVRHCGLENLDPHWAAWLDLIQATKNDPVAHVADGAQGMSAAICHRVDEYAQAGVPLADAQALCD